MRHRISFFSSRRGCHGNEGERMPCHEPPSQGMPSLEQLTQTVERTLSFEQPPDRDEKTASRKQLSNREENDYDINNVTVSGPFVKDSIYGRPCKTNQFGTLPPSKHETFQQPVNLALFTRNGQPVLRDKPPCSIGLAVMKDSNSSLHASERNRFANVPEMFKAARQNTYWTNEGMHANSEQLNCRLKKQFRPDCITEAFNIASYANNMQEVKYPTEAANKKSFGQYTGNISALQSGYIDVAMIPLLLELPLPPPLPPLQERVPEMTNVHIYSTLTSPIQTGTKIELQKTCTSDFISELSENQVSSTSMDQDQVSVPELDGTLETCSQETPDLLQKSKTQKYEDRKKVVERECKCTPDEDVKQHEFSKERSIGFSCFNCARMSSCKSSVAKCEEKKTCKLDQDERSTVNYGASIKSDKNESIKESLNMEKANARADCRNGVKTTDDFAADKNCSFQPENMCRKSSRQINGNIRNPARLHRPWERDRWRNRTLKRLENENKHQNQRCKRSLWPLCNQKPCNRNFHNKRLSGLGINTYHSNLQHQNFVRERLSFSALEYFRPWEERETTRWGIDLENDQARNCHKSHSTQNSTNPIPAAEYWCDYSLKSRESHYNERDFDTGNNEKKSLKDRTFVVKTNDLMDTQEVEVQDSYNDNTNFDHEVTNKNGPKSIKEGMVALFHERPKNEESEKKWDFLMEENLCDREKDDHKENSKWDEILGTEQNENCAQSAMEEPIDKFAKTREDRYNHGHSYSEIVKSKTYQNKKKREKIIDEKEVVNKHIKKRSNHKTNTDCHELGQKDKKKISFNSLKSSVLLKCTPECDVETKSVPKTTEISKLSYSKFAKPDFLPENKLKGHGVIKRRLKSYKTSHLSSYKDLIKNSSRSSAKKTEEEKEGLTETIGKKNDQKNNLFVKPGIIKIPIKACVEKYRRVLEKAKKNKLKTNTEKEKQRTQALHSVHPKLRHKIAIPSVGSDKNCESESEKKNLKIEVEVCDTDNSVDKCKRDNDRFYYSKCKCTGNICMNSSNENDLGRLKQNISYLIRGKFVLSAPNTYEVETKKTKMTETARKMTTYSDDTVEICTLDKASLCARDHLLYRALALNALKKDKTKPLLQKKFGARKSPITTDMSKQELPILKETLTTETEKSQDQKGENNDSAIKGKKFKDTYKSSSVILDFPTTVYQPQRTAIGNSATQCLFGPVVSSTFYKAPGKSKVVRNSKEILIGYTKCPEDLGAGGVESQQHLVDSEKKEVSNIETSNIPGTVPDSDTNGTSLPRRSPHIDVMSANSNLVNTDEKKMDVNYNENLLAARSENEFCVQEKSQDSSLKTEQWNMPFGLNTKKTLMKFETCKDEIHAFKGVCKSQEKELEWKENKVEKSQSLICDSPFLQPKTDISSMLDKFEMHKRYLKCKQELTESCFSPSDMKMLPTVVLPSVIATHPFNSNFISDVEINSEFSVQKNNLVPENDVTLKNTTGGECCSSNGFDINCDIEKGITGNICMEFEPSNDEFEMYRSYQIQRTMMNAGVKKQYGQIDNLVTSSEWKCSPEKQACIGSPYDTTKHGKNNLSRKLDLNKLQDDISEDFYSTAENSVSVDTTTDLNLSDDIFVNVSCEENKVSDHDSIMFCDGSTKFDQKPNCSIMNTDEELQDTSKDLIEEVFTQFLKDEELISSMPINLPSMPVNPPNITKGETNMLSSEGNQSPENFKKGYVSPEISLLSPKCPEPGTLENEKCVPAKYEKEHESTFKSARTPVHVGACRKPRFEKRFPKPLPWPKSQKLTAEKELYKAAERFLGDFDHTRKRSCCKDKIELLVNPFTGKMETVKMECRKQNELALKSVQYKSGELSKNKKNEIKNNKGDKHSDGKKSKTGSDLQSKRSPDSGRVTRQQMMKKSILKQVQQKLKTKLKTDDSRDVSGNRIAPCKRSNKTENSMVPNRRISSTKLKAEGSVGSKVMSTSGKGHLRSECNKKKENVKSKVEDNFKSHKSEIVGHKRIGSKLKKMIDTRNKDTIQERARAPPGLCKICTYTCDHYLMLKMHCEEEHRLQCYRCEKKYKDKVCNILCSVLCLQ